MAYVAYGKITGWCGHMHRSQEAAIECRDRDRRQCERNGTESDRMVYEVQSVSDIDRLDADYDRAGRLLDV